MGNKLEQEAQIFGGKKYLTASDVAVAAGMVEMGNAALVKHLTKDVIDEVMDVIHEMVTDAIDRVKVWIMGQHQLVTSWCSRHISGSIIWGIYFTQCHMRLFKCSHTYHKSKYISI